MEITLNNIVRHYPLIKLRLHYRESHVSSYERDVYQLEAYYFSSGTYVTYFWNIIVIRKATILAYNRRS